MSETFFSLMLVQSLEYISSSLSLVMSVSKPKNEKIFSAQADMARLISFSTIPVAESAPPSSPPWPGSIITSGIEASAEALTDRFKSVLSTARYVAYTVTDSTTKVLIIVRTLVSLITVKLALFIKSPR